MLIRSKLSSIKGAEIGGELIYNAGRAAVMQSLNEKWRAYKARFNQANLNTGHPDFENRLLTELRASIQVQPEDFRSFVESQIKNVIQNKPQSALDATQAEWQAYYRTLTNLA